MALLFRRLTRPHIWKRLLVERFSEPLHLNLLSLFVAAFGSLRAKILFDLCIRQQHAFGLLTAADDARAAGFKKVTVIEFGVANGVGLLNICLLAEKITKITGVSFNIVGFDNVSGMPPLRDYRDHPELYKPGWYPMEDPERLRAKLPPNANLILGDITDTVPRYLTTLSSDSPIGFVSVDVDYYWSATNALAALIAEPKLYLPRVTMYFDDVASIAHNPWCGELAAIGEFNSANNFRKIAPVNFLRVTRLFKNAMWIDQMYTLHVLDHPARFTTLKDHGHVVIDNPYLGLKGKDM
ncbi:hypothetical protein [Tunturiibacter psychrotolerans]|uniref:hypothetical protein n=1 Tax=Tunturiibacter psychrotolerans TaxID=3069686 RepID=UPI003D1AF13F